MNFKRMYGIKAPPKPKPMNKKQQPIIIIEDDQDDCDLISNAFHDIGVSNEIKFFPNGLEALHYLQVTSERPYLILSDVNMPLMNGFDLKQQIVNNPELKKKAIPFVFFSTSARQSEVGKAYDMMAQGYFLKSHNYNALKMQIKTIIDYWSLCKHPNSNYRSHD